MKHGFKPDMSLPGGDLARQFFDNTELSEELSGWRFLSRFVHALVNLSAAIRAGERGDPAQWRLIVRWEPGADTDRGLALAAAANLLLLLAQPTPIVTVTRESHPSLIFVNSLITHDATAYGISDYGLVQPTPLSGTLFAAIAVAAASFVTSGRQLVRCSECEALYEPRKLAGPGQLNFCRSCGARASWRLSKRRQRAHPNHRK